MPLTPPHTIGDTTIQTLWEAKEAYPAMLEAIGSARESILLANYCMDQGEAFERFSAALQEAAGRGARVRIMFDTFGSHHNTPEQLAALQAAGVELLRRRQLQLRHPWRYNHGLHKKLLVIDGVRGFTGGVGIGDFWLKPTPRYPAAWRDTHFELTGPVVAEMAAAFASSWQAGGGAPLPPTAATAKPARNPSIITVDSMPPGSSRMAPVGTKLLKLITATKRELTITTGYLSPSRLMIQTLRDAAHRGVRVRILTNGPYCTHYSARDAGRHRYAPLLAAGIHIYEYQPTKIHAKITISDGAASIIGSANLNFRSLYHDEEFSLIIRHPELAAELDAQFERDLPHAIEITASAWSRRPRRDKLRQATAGLARYIF